MTGKEAIVPSGCFIAFISFDRTRITRCQIIPNLHFHINSSLDDVEAGAERCAAADADSDEVGLILLDSDDSGGHRHSPSKKKFNLLAFSLFRITQQD